MKSREAGSREGESEVDRATASTVISSKRSCSWHTLLFFRSEKRPGGQGESEMSIKVTIYPFMHYHLPGRCMRVSICRLYPGGGAY